MSRRRAYLDLGLRGTARGVFVLVLAALVAVKLWLVAGQTLSARGPAAYDDALFMRLAGSLAHGHWLGRYDQLTLAKGPFYPMWIAASFALGVPLLLGQHLLYAFACAVFVSALAPALRARVLQVFLFSVLLFNPCSYADGAMTRILREGVYPGLSLLVLGTAAGLVLRLGRPRWVCAAWGLALGASLAGFWLCREERVWIAPALFLSVAGLAVLERPVPWRRLAGTLAFSLTLFAVVVGGVQAKNLDRYGAFVVTEFTEGPFPEGYAALARVRHAVFRSRVPLPAEARARIYAASPSFAELRPFLEGALCRHWTSVSCRAAGICDEIAGGWMVWALRDAAALAGHSGDAARPADYWRAVAREVNTGCDAGRLDCAAIQPTFLPQLRPAYLPIIAASIARALLAAVTFEGVSTHPSTSIGDEHLLAGFHDLSRTRLSPTGLEGQGSLALQGRLDARKLAVLEWILGFYQRLVPILGGAAVVALAVGIVCAFRRRRPTPLLVVTFALLVGAVTRLVLVALVDATSFNAINPLYLSPAYPLLLGVVALAVPAAIGERGLRDSTWN